MLKLRKKAWCLKVTLAYTTYIIKDCLCDAISICLYLDWNSDMFKQLIKQIKQYRENNKGSEVYIKLNYDGDIFYKINMK